MGELIDLKAAREASIQKRVDFFMSKITTEGYGPWHVPVNDAGVESTPPEIVPQNNVLPLIRPTRLEGRQDTA